MTDLSPQDRAKRAAGLRAAEFVESGMTVGLGTGSTAVFLVRRLGERVREEGLRIVGVPTSERTAALAREEGIEVVALDEAGWLDLTIDGADEVDGAFRLIKGGGGALLREKIVAAASDRMVAIADEGKRVDALGAFPLPVEVIPFGWRATQTLLERRLAGLDVWGRESALRTRRGALRTDEGNPSSTCPGGSATRGAGAGANQCRAWWRTGSYGLCALVVGHGRTAERRAGQEGREMAFDVGPFRDRRRLGRVRAARMAASTGARVALAEQSRMGGTCVIRGCVPKKLMVFASQFAEVAQVAPQYGWSFGEGRFDWRAFRTHLHEELDRLEGVYRRLLDGPGEDP
jgi:ribose 5-phosphate isomerase A